MYVSCIMYYVDPVVFNWTHTSYIMVIGHL